MNLANNLIFLLLIHAAVATVTLPFDTSQINKHGKPYTSAECNGNTVIDFAFSSSSALTLSGNVGSSASLSSLRYLDVLGNEVTYTLTDGQLVSQSFISGYTKSFVFQFTSGSNQVFVAVPILDNGATPTTEISQAVNMNSVSDPALSSFKSVTSATTSVALSTFNFLNDFSYSNFYEIMDISQMTTLLISKNHYLFGTILTPSSASNLFVTTAYSFDSTSTGDVLCWGSQITTGFFQTHMRESVPLWTFLFSTLFFWLFLLLSNEVTPEVYERSFKDNKWTSWSLYSLYWLCHEEWFTRTARTSLFLINFFWQCIVLAAIYNHQGTTAGSPIIIWAAVVAYVASIPIPYLVGNLFFQRVYETELEKFQLIKEMHHQMKKDKHEEMQRSAILKEEHIYGIFYFYYSMCIMLFMVFGILSVHLMQQFPRDFYYLHWHWLASAAIALGLDHLLIDPIMTLIFGNSNFYRSRGYYYNANLGELAREAD